MIGRRCGGATSQEATGKFSSPAPLPDRCCAASNVMGAWYHKQRAACDIAGNPDRQCRRLDDLLWPQELPRTAQFDTFWPIGPALVPPRSTGQIGRENR